MAVTPVFGNGVFPFGAHVFREHNMNIDAVLADLPLLKRLGFNMIKIQESWSTDEPSEGQSDFSRADRLLSRAAELGLGVYLGLTMEQAPAWLWRKFPDAHMVYANGMPHNDTTQYLLPVDGKPGPCWDHPGARAAGEHFIAALARHMGRHDNLWTWNTWQEIGFWHNDGGALGLCYCVHTLARFREWLQTRYGDLDALNRAWHSAFGGWQEVEPPRRYTACPPFIDWRHFMENVYLTRALQWKTAALCASDPSNRPVFSHTNTPVIGAGSTWRWAEVGSFFGTSNYPAWWAFNAWDDGYAHRDEWHANAVQELWEGVMLRADMTRCITGRDRACWGAEFQGGPISTNLHLGRTPNPADIRRWVLGALASGMHGISFWNHRAEQFWQECNGFGLLDPRGETSDRIEEAGRLARAIDRHADLFSQGQTPRARVAIVIDDDLYQFCKGTSDETAKLFSYNLRGHYARLWRLGFAVDFVEAEEIAKGGLDDYAVAIQPMPLAVDAGYFAHLMRFVERGGMLIAEACPGRFDRVGMAPRAQMVEGAEELFGATHKSVQIVREPNDGTHWTPLERGFGEFARPTVFQGEGLLAGQTLQAGFYLQTLAPTTGAPILRRDDDVVGVVNTYGRGQAVLIGTFTGLSATAHIHHDSDQCFARLLKAAGVPRDTCGRLLRRRRVLDGQEAWFLINPFPDQVTETISVAGYTVVHDLLDEVIESSDGNPRVSVSPAAVRCLILTRDVDTDQFARLGAVY